MGRVEGKVALVTGAARGQGRSHAVRLASEGADIIAVDICDDIATARYRLGRPEDLEETAALVEKEGRRGVIRQADVRDAAALRKVVAEGVSELGRLDVVVANAGIWNGGFGLPVQAFVDAVDVNFGGVMNTVGAALPHLGPWSSIIATGSMEALHPTAEFRERGPGSQGYGVSKRMIGHYFHTLARVIAPLNMRANTIHPTNVGTEMLLNDNLLSVVTSDLDQPSREVALERLASVQAMPLPYLEPGDVSDTVLWLASDESKYVTGMQLRIDAGGYLKWANHQM